MASLFWVGGTGSWDGVDVTHWATSSGGSTHPGSAPGSGDTTTFDASSGGGTVTVTYDPTVTSITMGAFTGTLNMNGHTPTLVSFSNTGSGVRTLTMGSGAWTITGNATTIWNAGTTTNLTMTTTSPVVNCTYSGSTGTRTLAQGSVTESTVPSFNISAGSDTVAFSSSRMMNLNFTGFSGTLTNGARIIYGNLTLTAGMTLSAGTNAFTFSPTLGVTRTITSNGNTTMDNPVTISSTSTTVQLADSLVNGSTRTFTLTSGTFDANGKGVKTGLFASSGASTRVILMGTGTWELTGTGTVWDTSTATGLTVTPSSSTIKITDSTNTAITFAGGGKTFANVYWNRGASTATNTVTGTNTFADFKDDGTGTHSIVFPNVTTTVSSFSVSGTSGHLITLARTGGSGTFTLSSNSGTISCDYLAISNSTATGGSAWYAGANSTDGGGNTGWVFTAAPSGGSSAPSMPSIPSIPSIA